MEIFEDETCPPHLQLERLFRRYCVQNELYEVRRLIERGLLTPNIPLIPSKDLTTPLLIAIRLNCLPMLRMMLDHFEFDSIDLDIALRQSIKLELPDFVEVLLPRYPAGRYPLGDKESDAVDLVAFSEIQSPDTFTKMLTALFHHYAVRNPQNADCQRYFQLWCAIVMNNVNEVWRLLHQPAYRHFGTYMEDMDPCLFAVRIERRDVLQVYIRLNHHVEKIMLWAIEPPTSLEIIAMCLPSTTEPREYFEGLTGYHAALHFACQSCCQELTDLVVNWLIVWRPAWRYSDHLCEIDRYCLVKYFFKKLELLNQRWVFQNIGLEVMTWPLEPDRREDYEEELRKLQATKITPEQPGLQAPTLFDFMMNIDPRGEGLKFECYLEQLRSTYHGNFRHGFPHFGFALEYLKQRVSIRWRHVHLALQVMNEATGQPMHLPARAVESIFKHLTDYELMKLAE